MAADETTRPQDGSMLSAISNTLVAMMKRYYGKGPTEAKSYLLDDYLLVVMKEGLTTVERTLLDSGQKHLVREVRQRFQDEMSEEFKTAVETLTERRVLGYQSQMIFDPPTIIEFFVLEPAADSRAKGAQGAS
jgi:uncharacterized protein YbcI